MDQDGLEPVAAGSIALLIFDGQTRSNCEAL